MQVTIQTKITEESVIEFLEKTGEYIGHLRGKCLKALLKGVEGKTVKKQYIAKYGLTARQFNSLCSKVKGLIKATEELHQKNIRDSKERLRSLKKKIKALIKKLKQTKKEQREGKKSEKETLRWRIHHKKRKLSKLEAIINELRRLAMNDLNGIITNDKFCMTRTCGLKLRPRHLE